MLKKRNTILTAIDIGTSKICVLIAEMDKEGNIEVLGIGERKPADIVYKGDIVDAEAAMEELSTAVAEAENMAKIFVDHKHVYATISGAHIKSVDEHGTISIRDEDGLVKDEHIREAALIARNAFGEHEEREIITATDKYFILNGEHERRLSSPINHRARKLQGYFHIISGKKTYIDNLKSIIMGALSLTHPPNLLFSGIASAFGVASEEDLRQGTLFIDIGAGTTDYVLIVDKCVYHSACLTVGCDHIANDIALGLEINFKLAKKILEKEYPDYNRDENTFIELTSDIYDTHRKLPVHSIEKITELRLQELFEIIHNEIKSVNMQDYIRNGIVVSGGGALLSQTIPIIQSVFNKSVRRGALCEFSSGLIDNENPEYGAVWGLSRYAAHILPKEYNKNDKGLIGSIIHSLDSFSISFIQKLKDLKESLKW